MLKLINKSIFTLVISFIIAGSSYANQRTTVQWGCDAPEDSVCHFRIQHVSGEVTQFEMPAGTKRLVKNVIPRKDNYCVCVNVEPPEDFAQCKRGYKETFCKATTIFNGYNN